MKTTLMGSPDVTNTDPAYWEKVLELRGLSMDCGAPSRSGFRNHPDIVLFSDLKGRDKNEIGLQYRF